MDTPHLVQNLTPASMGLPHFVQKFIELNLRPSARRILLDVGSRVDRAVERDLEEKFLWGQPALR
jgi:hypothetical protein